jgi:L-amino acid N-acyltransferase YncA
VNIRKAEPADYEAIWSIFHEIVSLGETYAFAPDTTRQEAIEIWIEKPTATYVAELDGQIVGTYYIKPNQPALGSHVCNCGYMVPSQARGRGIATAMCEHSQFEARRLGFRAMQFNLVVSTNEAAVRLWRKLGFKVVGIVPKAFNHTKLGFVDACVMYKWLEKGT